MKAENEEMKRKLLELRETIKKLIVEFGASEKFAHNAATHIAEAIVLTPKSYEIIKDQMKSEEQEVVDAIAFRFFCRAMFAKEFNEAVLPENMKYGEQIAVVERKPSCYA